MESHALNVGDEQYTFELRRQPAGMEATNPTHMRLGSVEDGKTIEAIDETQIQDIDLSKEFCAE